METLESGCPSPSSPLCLCFGGIVQHRLAVAAAAAVGRRRRGIVVAFWPERTAECDPSWLLPVIITAQDGLRIMQGKKEQSGAA